MANAKQATQQTQPKGKDKQGNAAKPATIPVPKRKDVFDLMRAVTGKRQADQEEGGSN